MRRFAGFPQVSFWRSAIAAHSPTGRVLNVLDAAHLISHRLKPLSFSPAVRSKPPLFANVVAEDATPRSSQPRVRSALYDTGRLAFLERSSAALLTNTAARRSLSLFGSPILDRILAPVYDARYPSAAPHVSGTLAVVEASNGYTTDDTVAAYMALGRVAGRARELQLAGLVRGRARAVIVLGRPSTDAATGEDGLSGRASSDVRGDETDCESHVGTTQADKRETPWPVSRCTTCGTLIVSVIRNAIYSSIKVVSEVRLLRGA
ncbi:hypothetical protein C8R45DRAFT_1084328 [Mycena sanguinolenta]|nr:hypothetical protein C8R45DRAFT_1084328 [Mycena sanguinolenta]